MRGVSPIHFYDSSGRKMYARPPEDYSTRWQLFKSHICDHIINIVLVCNNCLLWTLCVFLLLRVFLDFERKKKFTKIVFRFLTIKIVCKFQASNVVHFRFWTEQRFYWFYNYVYISLHFVWNHFFGRTT